MRKVLYLFVIIFMVTACSSDTEDQVDKSDYLAWKSDLVEQNSFSNMEELNCDITISVNRVDSELVSYITVLSNPKEDMNNIKMMVVHNYFTESLFPTIGIFDEERELLVDDLQEITLVGYIETTNDIKKLDLELKIWIEYTDNEGNIKDIYYKTTK